LSERSLLSQRGRFSIAGDERRGHSRGAALPLENLEMSEQMRITSFIILSSDVDFSHDTFRHSVLDLSFTRCPQAGEPGSAPPNRRTPAVREKTPEIDPVERLALGVGHCPTA
jgi:hypothetical protein